MMFVAEKRALFTKYCPDIWLHLLKQIFPKRLKSLPLTNYSLFIVFVIDCPISWELLMDIIFGYPLIEQFDAI